MLIERVELTLSHVDLGALTERAAMTLFGVAQAHRLTEGTGHTLRDVTDAAGAPLYPGYYWTHLVVPPSRLLARHRVWDTVAVGVETHSFGSSLLTSHCVLGARDEIGDAPSPDLLGALPAMRSGSMWYVDGSDGDPRPAAPKKGSVANLPPLTSMPPSLQRFRQVRDRPAIDPSFTATLTTPQPIAYALGEGRELNGDHGVMFARYIGIADAVERELLCRHAWPPIPVALVDCLAVLERETFYFANVRGERPLRAAVRARVDRCAPDLHGDDRELVSAATLTSTVELYDDGNVLLVSSKAKKLFAVPTVQTRLTNLAARLVAAHAPSENP
jgi:probable biosynthetic protein (TIGR04098 family)